jgi:ATP-dependent RNA helicase DDX46/PRP5
VTTSTNEPLDKEAEQRRLEEEMQKRKHRIEQWRAERRTKLGIDKAMQLSILQASQGKAWSLEDEHDEDEEDLQNVVIPSTDLKRDLAAARESALSAQADKQREAMERAAEAAALIAAACANTENTEEDDDDPLDKYMEDIAKEVKSFRGNNITKSNGTNTKVIKQEQVTNNPKASIIKIVTKNVKTESVETNDSTGSITNGHHSTIKIESMDTNDGPSRFSVRSGVAKRAKDKGAIMEQDIDGLEYSSEEEPTKAADELEDLFAMSTKKSKAEMITTDHEKIYYRPFRKAFYTEVPEITNMTVLEVAAYREELDGIKIVGKRCPRPIKTWSQCITSDKILQSLKRYNYEKPTPIQAQALPIILSGRDMIGIAKTGSGKTLAFLLPMFRHIKHQPPLEGDDGPIAIIMAPTRELALQTTKECKKFAKLFNIRCVAVYGGTGISEQIAELKRGAEIIVCTPGRMIDMLAANGGKVTNVRRVTYVVIDEADRMFDMGF